MRVVFLTNGEAVANGLGEKPETVIAAREREALNACQKLGLNPESIRWLHLPDGQLPYPGQPGFDKAAAELLAEIESFAPGEIYCPHWQDVHPDHVAAAHLTHQAVRLWRRPCAMFYYPVWLWFHSRFGLRRRLKTTGAWRLDVSKVRPEKTQAMSAYLDAPRTSRGLRFCGDLPDGFLKSFRQNHEVYFTSTVPTCAAEPGARDSKEVPLGGLKALFFSPAGAAYGSERSMLALLRVRTFEAEVVCPGGGVLEQELNRLGIKHHPLEFNRFAFWQNPFWHWSFYRRARNIIRATRPDVVVINLAGNTPLITLAAIRSGIPILRICRFEFKPPSRWSDSWAWQQFQVIICPSDTVRRQIQAWAPPQLRSQVLRFYDPYSGFELVPQDVNTFRETFHLDGEKIIGYVGRMDRGKHIGTAIEALAIVRKRIPGTKLLIVGGATSQDEMTYQNALQCLAADLGVREAVIFTDFLPAAQVPAAMASLHVCILPSESESFGMVLMEAWVQGVPTVASNVSGCSEITQASGGGRLAPVGDAAAFAQHVMELLDNPVAAVEMGRRGKEWVAQNCDPAVYATRFESLIRAYKSSDGE